MKELILDHKEISEGLYEDCKDTRRGRLSAGFGIGLCSTIGWSRLFEFTQREVA